FLHMAGEFVAACAQCTGEETSGETVAMQHAEICRTLTEKINLLKDKHEMLSSLLPDVRLLYGTQPGPRTPVMYLPGIVFLFSGHKIGYINERTF
ncbi:hypothetical protein JTL94_41870, partial [Pseudomonas aeruginosa]|nr:hypothetical protein [Pseudomonas aeruginosa]